MSEKNTLWMLGLEPEDERLLRQTAGDAYHCDAIDLLSAREIASILEDAEGGEPLLLWAGGAFWRGLEPGSDLMRSLALVPTALVLEPHPGSEALEQALEAHVQQVVRSPLAADRVFDVLSRAREARNVYNDMTRMAREIVMNRELLERKSGVCSFLFEFFGALDHELDAAGLVRECGKAARGFFDATGFHAAWWGEGGRIDYFLGAEQGAAEAWHGFLRERAARFASGPEEGSVVCVGGSHGLPENANPILLPLNVCGRVRGLAAVAVKPDYLPGRDMAQALQVVCRHLALALWAHSGGAEPGLESVAAR